MNLKPLGVVKEIVENAGMSISYAYDDLVFLEHNDFLLQFTDNSNELMLHVNSKADESAMQGDITRLKAEASARRINLRDGRTYTLNQAGNENIHLEFGG